MNQLLKLNLLLKFQTSVFPIMLITLTKIEKSVSELIISLSFKNVISKTIINQQMGGGQSGALNAAGFSSSIKSGILPRSTHLTYAGSFNELYYRVGARSDRLLDLYYGYSVCNAPMKIPELGDKNQFLGLFLKSKLDGQQRTRPIHAVVVLDISGSMGVELCQGGGKSRIDLSREAIKMLFKKLKPNDVFSLVTFTDQAKTLIPSEYVSNLEEATVHAIVDREFQMNGTVMKTGFAEAEKNFRNFKYTTDEKIEKRIIMLTDVCDNAVEAENEFIQMLSNSEIHSTIIGVSQDFRSQTCEKLIKIKGFNYFCAVEDSDLQKYLFDNFDYTFFPLAYKVQIEIDSPNVRTIEVYGTPDSAEVLSYGNPALKNKTNFVITKMESAFPSDFVKDKEGFETTQGGLILVKLVPKDLQNTQFSGKLRLRYTSVEGNPIEETYDLNYKPAAEQFHSMDTMVKATQIFYYTYCMKYTLDKMNAEETKLSDTNKSSYVQNLNDLMTITPETKKEEVTKLAKIIEDFKEPEPAPLPAAHPAA